MTPTPAENDEFSSLPIDSDVGAGPDTSAGALRVIRLLGELGIIFLGGTVGTALRALVEFLLPPMSGLPIGTLLVNLVGAFVLGALLELLSLAGDDSGWRRRVRLLVGTGLLGGFTTYSAFALETLTVTGSVWLSVFYSVGSVVVGSALALLGIVVGRAIRPRAGQAS
jgi:CrcB protein